MEEIVLAITGASGMIYAKTILEYFYKQNIPIKCLVSKVGERIWEWEIGKPISSMLPPEISLYAEDDWWAPMASGSYLAGAMVIMPCSMGTLAAIAKGVSNNLIHRTADVMLKEKRSLILVPRETPVNVIQLRNMLSLAEAGTIILPAMPAFYQNPKTIQDLANFIVGRVLDLLKIPHELTRSWDKIQNMKNEK